MDDENRKEENEGASTSKKKETKEKPAGGEYEEEVRDDLTYSNNSSMTDFSTRSRALKAAKKRAAPTQVGKRAARRKYPPRVRRGRVIKRRRPYQPPKRRHRTEKPQATESISTHFTTSKTGSAHRSCKLCGHRCCGRRYGHKVKKVVQNKVSRVAKNQAEKQGVNRKVKNQNKKKRNQEMGRKLLKQDKDNEDKVARKSGVFSTRAAVNQVGSIAKVLSPLLIATTDTALTADEPTSDPDTCDYTEITPEIIYEVLERLTRWRQIVPIETILKMIKVWYPVNPNEEELVIELNEKLAISAIAGITMEVIKNGVKFYCLTCELMRKGLKKTHVSMFWQLYADTMSPVKRRVIPQPPPAKPSPASDDKETKEECSKKTHH